MTRILMINPNSSPATTEMMLAIARSEAPSGIEIVGATARRSPPMIVEPATLAAAADEVVEIGVEFGREMAGIIVSAFGDPGLMALRGKVTIPVVGIAEAAMLQASARDASSGERRFGVATVTPALVASIHAHAEALGLSALFAGVRLTPGDPIALAADPEHLAAALAAAVTACIEQDGAEAVIIGGGPLGDAATALSPRFDVPIVAPIPAAMRRLGGFLGNEFLPATPLRG